MRFLIIIFSAIMIISPVFYGCNKKAGTTSAKAKASAVEKIEVKPEILIGDKPESEKGYVYDPAGRRDPFVPLVVVSKGEKKSSKIAGNLESYDIGDFTAVAIAKKGSYYYALLIAPDNKSYTVKEGTVIGLHNGKVLQITSNKILIKEYVEDYTGKQKSREILLELHKGEVE
ncbi:MAG: pilus assembly protein PilP [Nitrospirota bacterium]